MTYVDNSRDAVLAICNAVLAYDDGTNQLSEPSVSAWIQYRKDLEAVSTLIQLMPAGTQVSRKLRPLPVISFKGSDRYSDAAAIQLEWPGYMSKCQTDESGASWYVTDSFSTRFSIGSVYSTGDMELVSSRLSSVARAYQLIMMLHGMLKGTPIVAVFETPEDVIAREEQELYEAKRQAILTHIESCSERRALKPGQAKWCRSYDRKASLIQAEPGVYDLRINHRRYYTRSYELYIGDPRGSILRRMT